MKLIECPRDAMQGLQGFIPTKLKTAYLNLLLEVGFHTLDFGSFVSPKAIPQMADTAEVLANLDLSNTRTKLLAIVANLRGVEEALKHPQIQYLGFPFSISETFQQRNTNSSIEQSLATVIELLSHCDKHNKQAVIYLSMGFGNPYGDEWNYEIIEKWMQVLINEGVEIIALSDTIGVSTPETIENILPSLLKTFSNTEIGVHLHSTPQHSLEKIKAAYHAGVKRIDSALKGYGGCPMAADSLTGNIATEQVISFLHKQEENVGLNLDKWAEAMAFSEKIFG
ncbi:hydroxymethylglutaryl-CoA lyase [Pedobacter sp. MW01-1-1]|uniref:hydroxymethylglutaryl-CoA lyase n=1 Tax=Pedobacter sp. MW01-1-1 TaxID=3383027 RepID=UPI003FF03885